MRADTTGYVLKEYGSWSVLIIAFSIGVVVSQSFSWSIIPLFCSLGLLVNSKQAYMKWQRRTADRRSFIVFSGQVAIAAAILLILFRGDITMLLPLLVFPVLYFVSNKFLGEHALLTEVLGFSLLSLAAVLAKYLLVQGLDVRLFLGVMFYFTAGVFKIKVLLYKKMRDRLLSIAYILVALFVYRRMYIPVIILLPLADNVLTALRPYKIKLRTVGWIEVAKGLLFLGLFIYYY